MDQQHHGKTKLSIELAKKIDGEIISADSMQIYKHMDIGSAKPSKEEMQNIKHYLLDFVEPSQKYSVANFNKDAKKAIEEILSKSKTPIIVGGTGLYIDSLVLGIKFEDNEIDENYRSELERRVEVEGLQSLYEEAYKIDPDAFKKISPKDKKRIMRVLEIYHKTGKTKTQQDLESKQKELDYDYKVFAINMEREELYNRINKRVDLMLEQGLIEEVQNLLNKYKKIPTAMQALGYKEVRDYLNGEYSKEYMIEKIKMETRRYAKRQLTWFRKNKNIIWLDGLANIDDNIYKILENI